jgi:hypothetical protein
MPPCRASTDPVRFLTTRVRRSRSTVALVILGGPPPGYAHMPSRTAARGSGCRQRRHSTVARHRNGSGARETAGRYHRPQWRRGGVASGTVPTNTDFVLGVVQRVNAHVVVGPRMALLCSRRTARVGQQTNRHIAWAPRSYRSSPRIGMHRSALEPVAPYHREPIQPMCGFRWSSVTKRLGPGATKVGRAGRNGAISRRRAARTTDWQA